MSIPQLQEYGLERMDDEAIERFVASHSVGVLGLPTDDAPYMIPMSYAFDGDSSIYFTYLLGESSQKQALTEQAALARFLVYATETSFNWRSVLLTGELSVIPEREYAEIEDLLSTQWRPQVLESVEREGDIAVYEFAIQRRTGMRHTGLPDGFRGVEE